MLGKIMQHTIGHHLAPCVVTLLAVERPDSHDISTNIATNEMIEQA